MRKHAYQLIYIPRGLYTLRLLAILAIACVLPFLVLTFISVKVSFVLIVLFSFGLAFLLFRVSAKFVRDELHVELKDDMLAVTEVSSLSKKKKELKISWSDIESYMFQTTQYYHILRLRTVNGKKVMLTLDHKSDQFARFEKDFHDKISLVNQTEDVNISLKPSLYETKVGLWLAVVLALSMIGWPLTAWLNDRDFQIGLALIFYSGAGFFIYMVYHHHKQKKASN